MTGERPAAFYCKLVFAEHLEPTLDFDAASPAELRARLEALVERFIADPSLEGVYLGKRREDRSA
jgi:hypothetical protein